MITSVSRGWNKLADFVLPIVKIVKKKCSDDLSVGTVIKGFEDNSGLISATKIGFYLRASFAEEMFRNSFQLPEKDHVFVTMKNQYSSSSPWRS